jgi:hypothetical protein
MEETVKKCPFNNFNDCIGEECAFYLKNLSASSIKNDIQVTYAFEDVTIPCAIIISGIGAFKNMAKDNIIAKFAEMKN